MTTLKIAGALAACCLLPATASAGGKPSVAPGSTYEQALGRLTLTVKIKNAKSAYVDLTGWDINKKADGTCSRKKPVRSGKIRLIKSSLKDVWQITIEGGGEGAREKRLMRAMTLPQRTFAFTGRNASGSDVSEQQENEFPC